MRRLRPILDPSSDFSEDPGWRVAGVIFEILGQRLGVIMGQESNQGGRVHISLYNLIIEIEQDQAYPDQLTDMSNRALMLFMSAIQTCKEAGLDIRSFELEEDDD